ncbi:hypothetical protein T459_30055 [Capsicum annuum]|uniref:Ubiquitin-like protease family profile domain-containing protein n=1 Tax=Capsicum annuum TaxID=4072 RepID=A0A2G2Y7B3_CAPAN|nr:hypothetical protein T459_30055 [Capsicum annuum]
MNDAGVEKSPQRFNPDMVHSLDKKFDVQRIIYICSYTLIYQIKDASDSQFLISYELLQSINLNYVRSEPVVQDDCRTNKEDSGVAETHSEEKVRILVQTHVLTNDEKRDESIWSDSQITILDELLSSLNAYKLNICFYYLRKKSKYEPHSTYKYNTVDCNFMNIVWTMIGVYSLDDPILNAEGHEYHLNEYINRFCMHAIVPRHTVDNIFIPVNVKDRDHWVLVVLSFSERYIFIYDSYEFSDHYAVVLAEIEKLAKIIPLCLKACNFYKNKDIDLDNHPRYKDKDMLDLFDVLFVDDLPQQPSESLFGCLGSRPCIVDSDSASSSRFSGDFLIEHYQDILSKGKSILELYRKGPIKMTAFPTEFFTYPGSNPRPLIKNGTTPSTAPQPILVQRHRIQSFLSSSVPASSSSHRRESSSFEDESQFTIILSDFIYFQLTKLVGDMSHQLYSSNSLEAFQMDVLVFSF